jgi:hypothetical protein
MTDAIKQNLSRLDVRPEPTTSHPKKRGGVDADALLRSLAPVVSKPEMKQEADEPQEEALAPKPVRRSTKTAKQEATQSEAPKQQAGRSRAKLDVEINPGEGTTAIYVRVPRTTHVALKLLALQNQAAMEGPTELASIVRQAVDEYLSKQSDAKLAA